MENKEIKKIVKERYSEIASSGGCCSCSCKNKELNNQISESIGYSKDEIDNVPEANLGLGCGNPVAMSKIKPGDIVLDLGSGAGFDCFLAAKRTGKTGKVIGIDMTPEMVKRASSNAKKYNYTNTEFILGEIENIPLEDNSIDITISNCVINLSPDKDKVFQEVHRVLKEGGKMYLSDIVLLKELSEEQKNNEDLLSGCVAGALQKQDYIDKIINAGFKIKILQEDKDISKRQYQGIALESLKIEATKSKEVNNP